MNITAEQRATIDRLFEEFRGGRTRALAVTEVRVQIVESYGEFGGLCVSYYHPGYEEDGSDWSYLGTTVLPSGAELCDRAIA